MGLIAIFMTVLATSFTVVSHFAGYEALGTHPTIISAVVEVPSLPTPTYTVQITDASNSPAPSAQVVQSLTTTLTKAPVKTPTSAPAVKSASDVVSPVSPTATNAPAQVPESTPIPTKTPIPTQIPTATPNVPSPTPFVASATQIDGWFEQFSREFGVDISLLRKIAVCESGYNTNARSKHGYGGMFQFGESAWKSTRMSMGLDINPDLRFNAEEAIKTAAYKISRNGTGAWPACSK